MRSSLHSMKSTYLGSHSQIGGVGNLSLIRNNNSFVAKDAKFNQSEQIGNFYDKLFGSVPISEKDIVDARKVGYIYRKYENGDVYYGQMENQKPHGHGIYIYWGAAADKKPYFYKGFFENGEFNGFGKLCKMLNQRQAMYCYQGNWKSNKRQGEGKQNYDAQNIKFFKGNFVNDQRKGHGVLFIPEGGYDGNWENGRMNGHGQLMVEKGPFKKIVSGEWKDDEIYSGTMKYIFKSTNQLVGQYKGGIKNLLRHGQGIFQTGNYIVQGQFSEDELVGTGILKNNSNPSYEYTISGNLNQPRLEKLTAQIKYGNNDVYQGQVQITPTNFIRRTQGKYYFANGKFFEGSFQDNDRGQFILK